MESNRFNQFVLSSPRRLALSIATYPGLALTGAKVSDIVTNPQAQLDAQLALRERYNASFVLSAMDLSAEAEAFGCTITVSDTEIPTVTGRLVRTLEEANRLAVPQPGDKRTAVYLETVQGLRKFDGHPFVFAGCIGPFSLAARLAGVSEAMELTLTEPDLMHTLVEKSARFLAGYLRAFQAAGADGIIMAEPAAGLLSPRGMAAFSSSYVRQIARAPAAHGQFTIILHNCAAKLVHLPAVLESGLKTFHFGAPMDLVAALAKVSPDIVLCGNLDAAGIFVQMQAAEITVYASRLLTSTKPRKNFVLSSGCDIPPNAPLAGLDAFFAAVDQAALAAPSPISSGRKSSAGFASP
jgi:uroporphyrinogen decarboxylase